MKNSNSTVITGLRFPGVVQNPLFQFIPDWAAKAKLSFHQPWGLFSQGTFIPESDVFRQLASRTVAP
jgi:hypothetical protein